MELTTIWASSCLTCNWVRLLFIQKNWTYLAVDIKISWWTDVWAGRTTLYCCMSDDFSSLPVHKTECLPREGVWGSVLERAILLCQWQAILNLAGGVCSIPHAHSHRFPVEVGRYTNIAYNLRDYMSYL